MRACGLIHVHLGSRSQAEVSMQMCLLFLGWSVLMDRGVDVLMYRGVECIQMVVCQLQMMYLQCEYP